MLKTLIRRMKQLCAALTAVALFMASPAALASSATPSPTPASSSTSAPSVTAWGNTLQEIDYVLKDGSEGDAVVALQERLRDLGYYNFKLTGFFGETTKQAVAAFQRDCGLTPDGEAGPITFSILYTNNAPRGYGPRGKPTPTPAPSRVSRPPATLIDWSKAKSLVAKRGGSRFRVRDYYTGIEYYMVRTGGTYHMDVEPATKKDNEKFKSTYGGRWSWDRRPVLVRFKSTWYAASINGMPHGGEDEWYRIRNNGMNGQVCIHFLNSRTHANNAIDPAHQRCIRIAAGKR